MTVTETLADYEARFVACDEFTRAYLEENKNVEARIGHIAEGAVHCYVYDRDEDVVFDPTLEQFSALNAAEYQNDLWLGDEHPLVEDAATAETVEGFETALEAF